MAPKPKKPFELTVPAGTPDVLAAAALGTALMKKAGTTSWEDYQNDSTANAPLIKDAFRPTPGQKKLLDQHTLVLSGLRLKPTVTVSYCTKCKGWTWVEGTPPTKCAISPACEHKPIKAPTLKSKELESGED